MKAQLIIGCLIALACSSCSDLGQRETASKSPVAAKVRANLEKSVIPLVDLENVRVDQALAIWSRDSQTYHPLHKKFIYTVTLPPPPENTAVMAPPSNNGFTPVPPMDYLPKVTVRRRSMTSRRLLDDICRQANLQWMIQGVTISIRPSQAPPDAQP